jgi:hypothetical protein
MKAIQDMKDLVEGINERICELGDKRRIVIRRTSDKWLVQAVCPDGFRFDLCKDTQRTISVWLRAYYRGLLMPRTPCYSL